MKIQTVGVIGAGQMGNGIAHVFALAGFDVLLSDISQEALTKALSTIEGNLKRQVSRGKIADADCQAADRADPDNAYRIGRRRHRSGHRSGDGA